VAEALRALVKVDRDGAKPELLAALELPSHRDAILKAGADGLAELGDKESLLRLRAMLDDPSAPDRRIAVMKALARLGGDDPTLIEALARGLDDVRREVRAAACEALAETGAAAAIDPLVARRAKEENTSMRYTIDESLEKLRAKQADLARLRQQVETLEKTNRRLDERLKKLEAAAKQ
jgi:HEAT repeat protein